MFHSFNITYVLLGLISCPCYDMVNFKTLTAERLQSGRWEGGEGVVSSCEGNCVYENYIANSHSFL
jgi:hypothetical protein